MVWVYIFSTNLEGNGDSVFQKLWDNDYFGKIKFVEPVCRSDHPPSNPYQSMWRYESRRRIRDDVLAEFGYSHPPFTGFTEVGVDEEDYIAESLRGRHEHSGI